MKLKMGADIEDLVLFEKSDRQGRRSGRDGRYVRDGKDGRSGREGRASRDGKGGRDGRTSRDGKDRKFGKGKDDRNARDSKAGRDNKDRKEKEPRRENRSDRNTRTDALQKPRKKKRLNDENFVNATTGLDESLIASIKADRSKTGQDMINAQKNAEKARTDSRRQKSSKPDSFENVWRINIKGEGTTKAWYMGQDNDDSHTKKDDVNTMKMTRAEKKAVKAENKKRSIDYLQDVSDLVMESFGKRKNRGK